ncbi:hypothetical protein ACHAQJ_008709 [Trichoderma viride]
MGGPYLTARGVTFNSTVALEDSTSTSRTPTQSWQDIDQANEEARTKSESIGARCPVNPSSPNSNNANQRLGSCASLSVWWDEPEDQDAENPMNWPATKKWANILTISAMSFLV